MKYNKVYSKIIIVFVIIIATCLLNCNPSNKEVKSNGNNTSENIKSNNSEKDNISNVSTNPATSNDDELTRLLSENNRITILSDYKDSVEMLKTKYEHLKVINSSRNSFGAKDVKLDILASRIGNMHCKEMAENKFFSHWNMKGYRPFERWGLNGGVDHIGENIFMFSYSANIEQSAVKTKELMETGHSQFMGEIAPNDGHKQQIINNQHTHVGFGTYTYYGEFRYAEEFLDKYINLDSYKTEVSKNDIIEVSGRMIDESYEAYGVMAYYDNPKKMSIGKLNTTSSYGDFTNKSVKALSKAPWDITYSNNKNNFSFKLDFSKQSKGLYYVMILVRKKTSGESYGSVSFSTNDAAIGLIIQLK